MFKKLRRVCIALFLLCLVGTCAYFLSKPSNRRFIAQKAAEIKEQVKTGEKQPTWQGVVVVTNVFDGDTVAVRTEQFPLVVVRLAGIDAPEMPIAAKKTAYPGQPMAQESADYLRYLLQDKSFTMSIMTVDFQTRPVVLLMDGDRILNLEPVASGMAEVSEESFGALPVKIQNALKNAELEAREKKRGIWALENYQRPVEYRLRHPKD